MQLTFSARRRSSGSAFAASMIAAAPFLLAAPASSQTAREEVRVQKRFANIQAGAQSGSDILVIVPQGTVLPVIERRGPWFVVEISPNLRTTGTPMRWYKDEKRGFMHESTVETSKYKLDTGWPQLPAGMAWGGVISADMDGDGNPSGKYLGGVGEGVITRAHGFDIDAKGFLWATDQQSQQVFKLSPKGEVLMTLGKKGVAGDGGRIQCPSFHRHRFERAPLRRRSLEQSNPDLRS